MNAPLYLSPSQAPTQADIAATRGPLLLEFGTDWCGHCRAARPAVEAALAAHPGLRHLRVEDGPGRALGRSFGVKLWPTLVLLQDGQEQARLVRPRDTALVAQALHAISGPVHSLNALLARQLARQPGATAFIEVDPDGGGERTLSVAQFDDLVGRAAAWLQERGVVAGDTVALWLVNRLDWLVLHFALARLGAAVMTVNTRYRAAEVGDLLARSQPRLLVLQLHFRQIDFAAVLQQLDPASAASVQQVVVVGAGPAGAAGEPGARALPTSLLGKPVLHFDLHGLPAGQRVVAAAATVSPDAPAILFTTSGTTSGPKLVVHSQRTVSLHVQRIAQAMGFAADGVRLLAALPFAGTFGYVSMLAALAAGKPSVVMHSFDAARAAQLLVAHRITHCFGSDEMFEGLLAHAPAPDTGPAYPALRLCGFAAFRAGAALVAEACIRRGLPMAGLYGSSEVHALFAIQGLQRPLAERLEGGGTPVNPEAEIRVRDLETGALLPAGATGLLEFRSPSNFSGYLNNPAATAAALDAEGWFSSGDIGHLRPDGSFVYLTRAGDAIRLGGYLVAPTEIEEVIKAQPGVAAAQVVAVDLGGKTRAVAFATAAPGAAPDAAAVIAAVQAQLAAFKVPARLWWVDAFPVVHSANGTKIQRGKLREMAVALLAAE
ncbi:MAG: AMP-binding protein [Pseudomonadota bacterium]